MKRNVTLRWFSVMLMTSSAVFCHANWVVETEEVDASPGAGLFNAVALDGAGMPMIAYYEATNAVLKGASLNETEMWQTMLLDDNGDVGQHCSGAVDGDGVAHVSYQYRYPYFGQTCGELKCLCGTNGAPVTLDNSLGRMGEGTALALDAAGNVHIAYQAVMLSGNFLKYIARTNGVWSAPQVVEDGGLGVAMALDSSGNPHIAHLDGTELRHVFRNGSGWTNEVIEDYGIVAGRTAIAIDSAGHPHVVFSTSDGLMYARHDGIEWSQETVHSSVFMGEVGTESPALALNDDDEPFISYQAKFGAPAAVVMARRVYNEGEETWEWMAEAWLQEGGGLGGQTAIAVDGRGVFHVAFHDAAAGTLGYASVAEDTDEDWLPDWWELEYFENLDQGAEDDPDGDELTNHDEYWGGTDPTVPDEGGGEEDPDGDGLSDEDEDFLGTDPFDRHTISSTADPAAGSALSSTMSGVSVTIVNGHIRSGGAGIYADSVNDSQGTSAGSSVSASHGIEASRKVTDSEGRATHANGGNGILAKMVSGSFGYSNGQNGISGFHPQYGSLLVINSYGETTKASQSAHGLRSHHTVGSYGLANVSGAGNGILGWSVSGSSGYAVAGAKEAIYADLTTHSMATRENDGSGTLSIYSYRGVGSMSLGLGGENIQQKYDMP